MYIDIIFYKIRNGSVFCVEKNLRGGGGEQIG